MTLEEALIVRALLDRLAEEQLCLLVEPEQSLPPAGDLAVYVRLLADARAEFGDGHPFVSQLARKARRLGRRYRVAGVPAAVRPGVVTSAASTVSRVS